MAEGDAERLRYRAEYCDLLEREVGELRTQVDFLRDVADGRRQPGTDPPNISSPPIRPHSAKEPKATPPRGQDSPLQIHGGQQPPRRWPSPATASRQPSTPSLCEDEEVDDMEWLQPTRSAGQAQDELEDDDPEELMCSATRSSMVLNELTGKMELRMVDGSAVVPSDKVTNREKFEILQERVVIMFEDRRLRKILTEWGNLIVERESKQNMDLLVVRRFQNKLKKKVIWRWYLDQQEEARMQAKMVHVKRKLGRMKLLRALARWKLFNENIRKSRMVVQHMLRRLTYYSLRGTFHVWWGKCRKKQRYLYLVEKFMARWRGNTLSNFLTLWYRLVKQYACYRVTVQRFSHRRVSGLYKEGYRHWRRLAQQSICGRSQSSALQALRACSVDSFFRGWDSTVTGATGYQAFCGVEVDPETRAVVQLVLPARLLKRLPPEICHLSKLTSLFLEGNYLKALPSEIGELSALTSMRLNNNQLTMLPSEIGRLSALHTLAAAGNMIEALPSTISSLSNLNVLNLQNNRLHVLPPAIGHLSGLHILALNGNQLQNLPPHISLLTNLKTLTLSSNQLTSVPPALWKLPSLGSLNLAGNKLRAIGDDIAMQSLSDLNLEDNLLQELPPAIGNLTHLKELNLTINKLTELPQEVTALTALEVLNIASNRLTALPPGMAALTSLTALYAYNNAITTVPPDVFNLTRLEKLSLSTNEITGLPAEQLGKLGLLRVLSLNENKIERLAGDFFVDMTNLEVLKLSDNRLSEVPRELGTLSNLQELSLDGNAIKVLPEEVSALAAVCEISVEENPISGVMAAALTAPHADKEPLPRRTRRKVKERARARPLDGLQTWAPSAPLRRIATRRQSDTDLGYLMAENQNVGMSHQTLPWESSPASTVGYNSTFNSPGNNDSLLQSPSVVVKGYNEPHAVDRDTTGRPLEHNHHQDERGDAAFPQRVPSVSRCMSSRVHDRSSSRRFVRSEALGSFKRSEGSHLRHSDSAIAPLAGLPPNAANELAVADTVFEEASDEGEEPSFQSSQGQPPRFYFPPPSPSPSDDGISAVKEEIDIEVSNNSTGSAINFFGVESPFIVPAAPAAMAAPAIDFFGGNNAPTSIVNSSASSTPQHQSSMSGVGFFGVSEPFIMPQQPPSSAIPTSSVMSAPAGAYFNTPASDRNSRPVALCNSDDMRGRFQFGVPTSPEGMQQGTTRTPHPPLTSASNNGYDYFGAVGPSAAAPSNSFQQYFNKYPPTNPLFQA